MLCFWNCPQTQKLYWQKNGEDRIIFLISKLHNQLKSKTDKQNIRIDVRVLYHKFTLCLLQSLFPLKQSSSLHAVLSLLTPAGTQDGNLLYLQQFAFLHLEARRVLRWEHGSRIIGVLHIQKILPLRLFSPVTMISLL